MGTQRGKKGLCAVSQESDAGFRLGWGSRGAGEVRGCPENGGAELAGGPFRRARLCPRPGPRAHGRHRPSGAEGGGAKPAGTAGLCGDPPGSRGRGGPPAAARPA